jgi:hypothetical protein
MLALERLARFASAPNRKSSALYAASFAIALGMTNHHLLAFFFLPALAIAAVGHARRRGLRPLWVSAGLGLLGLGVYIYLPLRAARQPPANLGDPITLTNFLWVLSARVYARAAGSASTSELIERYADSAIVVAEQFYGVFLLLALLGLYAGLRQSASRRLCLLWAAVAAPFCLLRPLLTDTVRGNPDAIAYFMPGLAALAVLAVVGVAAVVALAREPAPLPLRAALWLGVASLLAAASLRPGNSADLSAFHAPDSFDEYRIRRLPPRAVLLATTPQTVFRSWELSATERLRPDLLLLPLPFLNYPGVAASVARRSPELAELALRFVAEDRLEPSAVARLAARRPVLIELDQHTPTTAYPGLEPRGLLYAQVGQGAGAQSLDSAAGRQQALYRQLEYELGADIREAETARQLLWLHYMDALFYAARGRRGDAREAVAQAAQLFPAETRLAQVRAALDSGPPQDAVLDVQPFLAFDPPAN